MCLYSPYSITITPRSSTIQNLEVAHMYTSWLSYSSRRASTSRFSLFSSHSHSPVRFLRSRQSSSEAAVHTILAADLLRLFMISDDFKFSRSLLPPLSPSLEDTFTLSGANYSSFKTEFDKNEYVASTSKTHCRISSLVFVSRLSARSPVPFD
jgi:hypothetical protein